MNKKDINNLIRWAVDSDLEKFSEDTYGVTGTAFDVAIEQDDYLRDKFSQMKYDFITWISGLSNNNRERLTRAINQEEKNICEHNNTVTNECSDCNDDELFDLLLKPVLNSIRNTYVGGVNNNLTDLIYDIHEGEADLTDELVEKIEQEILRRLSI